MAKNLCVVCHQRRGKRWCPALNGYICSYCCGSKRGKEIRCPSNCPYWMREKSHTATGGEDAKQPFTEETKEILRDVLGIILEVRGRFPELSDNDVKEGLNLVIRTYETRQRGIIYEHKSTIPQVAAISYQLGRVLKTRMEGEEGLGKRPSLTSVVSTLKETLDRISSYGENLGGPTSFLDYLSELERKERRKRMELL